MSNSEKKNAWKFSCEKLNFNNQWRAIVCQSGEIVTNDMLRHSLQAYCQFDRRTMDLFVNSLRTVVLHELIQGNAICLFDIVKLEPNFKLREAVCGDRVVVEMYLERISPDDVQCNILSRANRQFLKQLQKKMKNE